MEQSFNVIPRIREVYYFTCPNCQSSEEHTFTHLVNRLGTKITDTQNFGPWNCKECQHQIFGEIYRQNDGSVGLTLEVKPVVSERQITEGLVLLRSTNAGGKDPIYLVVHDTYVDKHTTENSSKSYWYDSHTCPTNWTRNVVGMIRNAVTLINNEDTDPHGIFEYVRHFNRDEIDAILTQATGDTVKELDGLGEVEHQHIQALFPELFSVTIDGDISKPGLSGPRLGLTLDVDPT